MAIGFKEDFQALAVCTVFLFLKMWAVGLYTGLGRGAEGKPAAPEVCQWELSTREIVPPVIQIN